MMYVYLVYKPKKGNVALAIGGISYSTYFDTVDTLSSNGLCSYTFTKIPFHERLPMVLNFEFWTFISIDII